MKVLRDAIAIINSHCRLHCAKSVRIRSNFGRHFPTFGIQSECGKMWTRITPNTNTFYAVLPTITKYELQVTSIFAAAVYVWVAAMLSLSFTEKGHQ